jgi:hypothetical protein
MNQNRISLDISEADVMAIKDAIRVLEEKLRPLLIGLEAEDKKSLSKMKDKSAPFVEKALQYMKSKPEFLPPFVDLPEAEKDYKAFAVLNDFERPLTQILRNLDDTSTLCGSEAFHAARIYYNSVQKATEAGVQDAKAVYDDLKQRFEVQRVKPTAGKV